MAPPNTFNTFKPEAIQCLAPPPQYDPVVALGSSLVAYWDAETLSSISLSGSLVTSWTDQKGSVVSAAAGAARPTYSATSFNGRPGITFNGTSTNLLGTMSVGFPLGATPGEIWGLVQQTSDASSAIDRMVLEYGAAGSVRRSLRRAVNAGVNVPKVLVGNGTTSPSTLTGTTGLFFGYNIVRATISATSMAVGLGGTVAGAAAVVPATAGTVAVLGASAPLGAGSFFQGQFSIVMVITGLLSTADAINLATWMRTRIVGT